MGFMLLPSFSAKDFDDAVWTQYLNERPSLVWLASVPPVERPLESIAFRGPSHAWSRGRLILHQTKNDHDTMADRNRRGRRVRNAHDACTVEVSEIALACWNLKFGRHRSYLLVRRHSIFPVTGIVSLPWLWSSPSSLAVDLLMKCRLVQA